VTGEASCIADDIVLEGGTKGHGSRFFRLRMSELVCAWIIFHGVSPERANGGRGDTRSRSISLIVFN
jgi:hypothetical protein